MGNAYKNRCSEIHKYVDNRMASHITTSPNLNFKSLDNEV
jgi:hypothetical protein